LAVLGMNSLRHATNLSWWWSSMASITKPSRPVINEANFKLFHLARKFERQSVGNRQLRGDRAESKSVIVRVSCAEGAECLLALNGAIIARTLALCDGFPQQNHSVHAHSKRRQLIGEGVRQLMVTT
jgi:hypothetical protein